MDSQKDTTENLGSSHCSSALFCTINHQDYMVSRRDSIYMSRKGKQDVRVFARGEWGGRYGEGKYRGLYRTVRVIDADSGELVRDYERVPDDLSDASLRRMGFVR